MDTQSGLARDLILFHRILTRGLGVVAGELARTADDLKNPGFVLFLKHLMSALEAHHRVEDEHMFPEWRAILPAAPYAVLEREHHVIAGALGRLETCLGPIPGQAFDAVIARDCLDTVQGVWRPHIRIEEEHFTREAFNQHWAQSEQETAAARYAEFYLPRAGIPHVALAFLGLNLEGEDRAKFLRLVPQNQWDAVLADQTPWQSMQPYLFALDPGEKEP